MLRTYTYMGLALTVRTGFFSFLFKKVQKNLNLPKNYKLKLIFCTFLNQN